MIFTYPGNIFIKRVGKENVFVKAIGGSKPKSNCISDELVKNNGQLMIDKSVKLFDMEKFVDNIQLEMKNSYPDRKLLEYQCLSCVAFVKDCRNIMELPVWVMIINIVALDLLKSRMIAMPTGPAGPTRPHGQSNEPTYTFQKFQPIPDCLEFHKPSASHTHVDHHKCSANRLTLRRWRALYGPLLPTLPPRDTERDLKIKKLREDLEEVRNKIGQIGKGHFIL